MIFDLIEDITNGFFAVKDKIIRLFVIGIIFLSLFVLQGFTEQRQAHQVVFMLMMISLFSLALNNFWVTIFILWSVFLFSFFKFEVGSMYISNIFFGGVFYLITKKFFKSEHIDLYISGFLWFVCINIFYSVLQVLGLDFIYKHTFFNFSMKIMTENIAPVGFMGNLSNIGMLMAMAIPILWTRGSLLAKIGSIGLFIPLWLSDTILCLIMGIIGLMFVLFFQINRRIWVGLLILFLLIGGYYYKKVDKFGYERIPMWKDALADWAIHPITGYGLDSFANITSYKNYKFKHSHHVWDKQIINGRETDNVTHLEWWDNPHNLIVSLLYEFGLPGLIIFICYFCHLGSKFKVSIKNNNVIGLASFIIVFIGLSMGFFPIFFGKFAAFIIPMITLFEVSIS